MSEVFTVLENLTVPPPRWKVVRIKGSCSEDVGWFWCLKDAEDYEAWRNGRKRKRRRPS